MSMMQIIVYGNGDVFREYFNAIVTSFGTSDFNTLIKLAILLAGTTIIFSFIVQRDLMIMVKWFGLYYVAIFVLFTPKTSVEIIDRVNQGDIYTVANVPLGLATLASYTSAIGDALTQLTEMNFTMPDDLHYGQTGMVFASRLVTESQQFEITDATFDKNLQSFISQCVFYDILLNRYTLSELTSSDHLWNFVSTHSSPARAFIYNNEVTVCKEGAQKINQDWDAAIDTSMKQYATRIFPREKNESRAKAELVKYLPISYRYLTNLSESAESIMKQQLMANAIQRGVIRMDGTLNASAAMESYAWTRAQEQKRLNNKTIGEMAAYWLPLMKNAFEAIMYGSFIFIVLLLVFPFGWIVLKNYIFTLLWIQLWDPLYAIINLMVSYYAVLNSSAAASGMLTLKSMPGLLQINSDIAGLAGYLTLSVPFLSAGLARGMAGTFTQLSQYVNGVTQAAGSAAASEAVTGNMNLGNTNFGNHNSFNTSANHYDTSGRYSGGSFTGQLHGGSTVTAMPDGSLVMNTQSAISNVGTSVNLANSIRQTASKQAEMATTHAEQNQYAYSDASSVTSRQAAELSQHVAHSKGSGSHWSVSTNAATATALNNIQRLTERFAHDHNMSYGDAARILGSVSGDIRAGLGGQTPGGILSGNLSLSGRREADHSTSSEDRKLYSEAKDYIHDTGYSKNMDVVERAVEDKSLKTNNEQGERLLDNMSASIDKAKSAKHDMMQSLQTAKSYREMAQNAEENSKNINSNLSQVFVEWLGMQPGTDGKGRMGLANAENMLNHHPELAQRYAEKFSQHYTSDFLKQNSQLPFSHQAVKHSDSDYHQHLSRQSLIQSEFNHSKSDVLQKASDKKLTTDFKIDESPKDDAKIMIQSNQKNIQHGEQYIEVESKKRIASIADENQKHPHRHNHQIVDLVKGIDISG